MPQNGSRAFWLIDSEESFRVVDTLSRFDNVAPVIASFGCRKTERLWQRHRGHGLPRQIERAALRKLTQIHRSRGLRDLALPPGNRLEALKGDRSGQHSIRINDQYRVCFRWLGEDAHDVEVADYH